MAEIIPYPSPNFGDRRAGKKARLLILHYTDMLSAQAALDRLCDPASEVSAHYFIDEKGRLYQLVDEAKRAWHCGVAFWQGERDVNSISIGIELANPGHGNGPLQPFPKAQIDGLVSLAKHICARHHIPPAGVIGHSDIAPGRKRDPGPLFPWQRLAKSGLGIWPETDPKAGPAADSSTFDMINNEKAISEALAKLGYDVRDIKQAISAFQLHFRPREYNGKMDRETGDILTALTR